MNLKPGDERNGYRIVSERLSRGAMAMAYRAEKDGNTVFLKQYLSPKPSKPWFSGYVDYQRELKRRIESSSVAGFTYRFIDFFTATAPPRHSEASKQYYQVFEWVTGGRDLANMIADFRADPAAHSWERRVIWAKVIMGSIAQLHAQKIAHIDLKPENLILLPRPEIAVGYQLKLIDMDFSLLTDLQAPWHGIEGYVGTPKWMSPEHRVGQIPDAKSDVFTCGLILYDLLATGNPYLDSETDEIYFDRVMSHSASLPAFAGAMPGGNNEEVAAVLHRCLSPSWRDRPTAADVLAVLNASTSARPSAMSVAESTATPAGHMALSSTMVPSETPTSTTSASLMRAVSTSAPSPSSAPTSPAPTIAAPTIAAPTSAAPTSAAPTSAAPTSAAPTSAASTSAPTPPVAAVTLCITNGPISKSFNITTKLNGRGLREFGEDHRFWDNNCQLELKREGAGWFAVPNTSAPNETLINGIMVSAAQRLQAGDVISVGRQAKGVQKLPLTVSFT